MRLGFGPAIGIATHQGGRMARVDAAAGLPAGVAGGEAGTLIGAAGAEDAGTAELPRRGGVRFGDGVEAGPEVLGEAAIAEERGPDVFRARRVGAAARDEAVVEAIVYGGDAREGGNASAAVPGKSRTPCAGAAPEALQDTGALRVEGAGVAVGGADGEGHPGDGRALPDERPCRLPGCAAVAAAAQHEGAATALDGGEQHLVAASGEGDAGLFLRNAESGPGSPAGVGAGVGDTRDGKRTGLVAGADEGAVAGEGEGVGAVGFVPAVEAFPGEEGNAPALGAHGDADVGEAVGTALVGSEGGGEGPHGAGDCGPRPAISEGFVSHC